MSHYCSNPKSIQLELSTVCNSLCPGCVRTDHRTLLHSKPHIRKVKYLDIDKILSIFEDPKGQEINRVEMCGNIDEPFAHPNLLHLVENLYNKDILIHTNGGIGLPKTYYEAGKLLTKSGNKSCLRFSIDGLKDTNHLYRHNVSWDKVMANLKAATSSGARVIWQMIKFPWNEHQIEEAKNMAKKLGCSEFWLRPDRSLISKVGIKAISDLRDSKKSKLHKRNLGNISDFRKYAQNKGDRISCDFAKKNMYFLSWEGKIWPCCFIANTLHGSASEIRMFNKHIIRNYDENFNSIYHHSFSEILTHVFYTNHLVDSWKDGGRDTKMAWRCISSCSLNRKRSSDGKTDNKLHIEHTNLI